MKHILTILILFIATTVCNAQSKGDNTIVIDSTVNLNDVKTVLFQNGYMIQGTDSIFITTSSKEMSKDAVAVKLMLLKTDTALYVKGLFKPTLSLQIWGVKTESDFEQLYFGGEKRSPFRKAWNEMDRIAKLLSSKIKYVKQ